MVLDSQQLEKEIQDYGRRILERAEGGPMSFFNPEKYINKILNAAMSNEEVKVAFFRFVDVLPTLRTPAAVLQHVHEYFEPLAHHVPEFLGKALLISPNSISSGLVSSAIKRQVKFVAERFIVGETPSAALPRLDKIRRRGLAYTVDLLGELTVSEVESETYKERYLELLSVLARHSKNHTALISGHVGEKTSVNVSVKLSALYSQIRPISADNAVLVLSQRLATIFRKAKELGAFVYVDMEDSGLTSIIIETFKRTLERKEFSDWDQAGIVLQAYLRRTEHDLHDLRNWAARRGAPISVRLVKGAYWDTESIQARLNNWPCCVWEKKESSDFAYEKHSLTLLENSSILRPAFASHNVRSLCHAIKAAEYLNVPHTAFELQMLYGMGESIKRIFVEDGFLVREYAPVGELIPGMGYLVRRLLENTTNEGFLRQSLYEGQKPELLLRKPKLSTDDTGTTHLASTDFTNEPLRDFSLSEHREQLSTALSLLRAKLKNAPAQISPIINGKSSAASSTITSTSPENPNFILAHCALADESHAREALAALSAFSPTWRNTPVDKRAQILRRTAEVIEEQRGEFTSAIILESGKPWIEADADVAEAIDFLRFYALEAERLFAPRALGHLAGENNQLRYEPRGIAVVISPWNFPLAIPCGMFSAALVTGNCAILKPAEQTPLIAHLLFEAFLSAGLPPQAAAFLPGYGETLGAYLVAHPKVSTIAFTGSKAVGLQILRTAGDTKSGFEHVKRVICEMGGKNAIIVDEDADLDEAIKGIITSAFGYAGQKCSACSRVIAVGECYQPFVDRLTDAVKSLIVGPPTDPATFVGPVIDEEAQRRLLAVIESGKQRATLMAQAPLGELANSGHYVAPTVFTNVPPNDPLISDEHFGPVIAVEQAKTFSEALQLACSSEYGLTGGVFSRSPANLALTINNYCVGNLYINRSCTGALVGRQPFGGAKMSGVGSKAGGQDYLLQFVIPRTITENTMRRGFAPK